jgi:UDP-N-acetylglucosamine 2-epimerase (non-hydrolysing)
MKVLTVIGTRPEGIKMAPIIQQINCYPQHIQTFVCVTGQHRDMLDQVLNLFGILPDFDLDLMQDKQTPSQVAARVLLKLDPLLASLQPDWMLVQGDTTTVMAAAIAAHHRCVRVGHVEAGLRTYDRANPFPEEMNRVIADHISDCHFAPTARACHNLLQEGITRESIHITGNTVTDALQWVTNRPLANAVHAEICRHGLSEWVDGNAQQLILVTAHRRENHGQPIRRICQALQTLVQIRPDWHIVYPVHRNPEIWQPVHELLGNVPGITLLPPVDYLTLVYLMKHSRIVLTDSGGIQEEAPSLGVPVLILRETTERPEAVEAGAARVIGTDPKSIVTEAVRLLDDETAYVTMAQAINPYGDGRAAQRIADVLLHGRCEEFLPQVRQI